MLDLDNSQVGAIECSLELADRLSNEIVKDRAESTREGAGKTHVVLIPIRNELQNIACWWAIQ
jgi:hypothetical protein